MTTATAVTETDLPKAPAYTYQGEAYCRACVLASLPHYRGTADEVEPLATGAECTGCGEVAS